MVLMSRFHSSNSSDSFRISETCRFCQVKLAYGGRSRTDQTSAVRWRVTDLASLQYGELAEYTVGGVLVLSDYVQSTDPFAIKTSVLGEALHHESDTFVQYRREKPRT